MPVTDDGMDLEAKVARLHEVTEQYRQQGGRIVIGGGPRSGKTQLSARLEAIGLAVHHTDILRDTHRWGDDSAEVAHWMLEPGPWIIEGVTAVRAVRKFMRWHPGRKPCDLFVWANTAVEPRTKKQEEMAKGCATIYEGIRGLLADRGVQLVELP